MQNQIFLAVVILLSVAVGLAGGAWLMALRHERRSRQFRARHDIPDILGEWRCQWFDETRDDDEPKVVDTVEIQRWTSGGEFVARGHQPQYHLSYPIVGDIDPARVVTLVYKAARYPYEPNRGIVCMELSRDGMRMEGRWFGRRFSGQLSGGKVKCFRLTEPLESATAA